MAARSHSEFRALAGALILLLALPQTAQADDWFVDAVSGSNANAGTSESAAWLTITHALIQVPDPGAGEVHRILVAPGTYDVTLGEVFPLRLRPQIELIGTGGSAATTLDADGASVIRGVAFQSDPYLHHDTLVQGFALRDGNWGVYLHAADGRRVSPTLRDLDIRYMHGGGVAVLVDYLDSESESNSVPVLENVRVTRCEQGLWAVNDSTHSTNSITATDCTFSFCRGWGISFDSGITPVYDMLILERCSIEGNGLGGILLEGPGEFGCCLDVFLWNSLIARNRGDGLTCVDQGGPRLEHCTVADNAGVGIHVVDDFLSVLLESCIVSGNGDDIFPPGTVLANYSNIGDGDAVPGDGSISVDPLFMDSAAGDYRLRFGSPCVDTGNPTLLAIRVDLDGTPRPIDGALDTVPRDDMGAYELAPLASPAEVPIGGVALFEFLGPPAGSAVLFGMRGLPLDTPVNTTFGALYLDGTLIRRIAHVTTNPGPPGVHTLAVPSDPVWIGTFVSLQARVVSGVAPMGEAWSNPQVFVFVP